MRSEIQELIDLIEKSLNLFSERKNIEELKNKLEELEIISGNTDFWKNSNKAKSIMKEKQTIERNILTYQNLKQKLNDNIELYKLAIDENDFDIQSEIENDLFKLKSIALNAEQEALMDGEIDGNDTFLEINAGAGGTESCDWALMISRMYLRWSERKGFKIELVSQNYGDEAGIKSVAYKIMGLNAYGWLKVESGVHRLVRISPFDSSARRHTSFCSVWVYPVIDESFQIEINPSETFTISEKFKIIFASTLTESELSPGEDELKVGATTSLVVKFRLFLSEIPANELLEESSNAEESIWT